MTKAQIIESAISIMGEWGLIQKGWGFGFNNRKTSLGVCFFRKKMIELSDFNICIITDAEIVDTIKHEVAHALDFEKRGYSSHDRVWQGWAIMVGARPETCYTETNYDNIYKKAQISKYKLVCPNGCEQPSHKKLKLRKSCGKCGSEGFDEKLLLTQIQNY